MTGTRPPGQDFKPAWPNRSDLPPLLPDTPALPQELIPAPIRPWLVDTAERSQVPLEFVVVPAIVSLGSLIGRKVGIRPKSRDDWSVVPNLWGMIVGRPGVMKSPAIAEAIKPIGRLAHEAAEAFKTEKSEAEAATQVLKLRIDALQGKLKTKIKNDEDITEQEASLSNLNAQLAEATAHERRYIINDGTVEKIGELLNQNPNGLLLCRDELSGFLRALDKPGREGDREFYLEGWNGNGGYTYDRIGRGTLHIDALTLSILGTIQPGKLSKYITGALQYGGGDDGLLQRFQLVVWSDNSPEWKNVDRWPDKESKDQAFAVFRALDVLNAASVSACQQDDEIPTMRFTPKAQELFNEWRGGLERRLRSPEMAATPAFESHLAKYRSLMPSLALIFHLVEVTNGGASVNGVSLSAARFAATWCEFLEAHAKRIYAPELQTAVHAAHVLAEHIKAGDIEGGGAVRDIYRHQWSGLATVDVVRAGLDELAQANWVRVEIQQPGGRPTEVVVLHPDFMRRAA
jgi:putative DNA primase/helicase